MAVKETVEVKINSKKLWNTENSFIEAEEGKDYADKEIVIGSLGEAIHFPTDEFISLAKAYLKDKGEIV